MDKKHLEIARLYSEERISTTNLAKKFKIGPSTVYKILKEAGVPVRKKKNGCPKWPETY